MRVGFSTAGSPLVLGESDAPWLQAANLLNNASVSLLHGLESKTAVFFDNEGNYCTGKTRTPRVVQKFARDQARSTC